MTNMEKKFIKAEKMEASDNENSIVGWASKPTMDRDRELILANAWQLDNYRKNPVVMLAHDYHTLPVGKCLWIKSTESGLRFKCKFANTDRGKEVYSLYRDQFLNGFSVGFKPRPNGVIDNPTEIKYKGVKRLFTDVELMEISCVPIPANQDAMVDQSSFIKYVKDGNIITKGLKDELEAIIEIIEKSDDTLEIEVKVTDVNPEVKTEDDPTNKETEDIETKAVIPNEDEAEKDFMERCMGDKSMAKLNEGFRTNACKMAWKKNQPVKATDDIEQKATMTVTTDEVESDFMTRCMSDKKMMTAYPDDDGRTGVCQLIWTGSQKKEPEQDSGIIKQESVQDFIKRILPDKSIEIKSAEELAQAIVKASGYDDMKTTVSAMEAQIGSMEPVGHPVVTDIEKSADAEGNPSLYDLTGAVDRALNPRDTRELYAGTVPTSINPINSPYRSVIDIFAVNYPAGHVVYYEYDQIAKLTRYFRIDYEYDLKMRSATVSGDPEEVLQSWISERYMTTETKEDDEIETKAGKVLSAKNKKILTDCMDQMMSAHAAMEEMMTMAEGVASEEKDEDEIIEKDEFEIIEKEEQHIEIDLDPVIKQDDGMIEISDDIIKSAVSSAIKDNAFKVNTKEVAAEVFAKLTGRATLK